MTPHEVQRAWIERVQREGVTLADGSRALVLEDKTVSITACGRFLKFEPHVPTVAEFEVDDGQNAESPPRPLGRGGSAVYHAYRR